MTPHLIQYDEISKYSRPISMHMDRDVVEAYISEAEEISIRPAIGDCLFRELIMNPEGWYNTLLLEGGFREQSFDMTFDSSFSNHPEEKQTAGLKKALAYYVQARLIRWNEMHVTRFGTVRKEEEHSSTPSGSERSSQYGEIVDLADKLLADVLRYIENYPERYPQEKCGCKKNVITNQRTRWSVIGD